jgi:hypothetical protein
MLDEMERGTHDPEALAQLFRLDHLTTRMRRQAEGLIILSGAAPGRGWRQPVPVVEVLRGAIGEIEDYVRVDLITESRDFITGTAVADVTHLLAELVENAVLYSPPETRVQVRTSRVANGYVVEVEDRGLGIPDETLDTFNERLAQPPEFDLADSDQLGLFVVSRLAARHQIKVSLRGSPYGGTAAIVLMPHRLVVAEADADADGPDAAGSGSAGPDATGPAAVGLDATGPGALGLDATGPGPAGPDAIGTGTTGLDVIEPWNVPSAGSYLPAVPFEPAVTGPPPGPSLGLRRDLPLDLPRRQRQANLAPQLRDAPPATQPGAGGYHEARSAEEVRAMISSIQKGWRSGRAAAEQADGDIPGGGPGPGRGEAG